MKYDDNEDIFRGLGIELTLATPDGDARAAFLKVAETLTRIGSVIEGGEQPELHQSCYILHKKGRYVIAHLSEMRCLDGQGREPTEEEVAVRNRVAILLESWGLIDLCLEDDEEPEPMAPTSLVKVIAYRDKPNWRLVSHYNIGRQRSRPAHAQHRETIYV